MFLPTSSRPDCILTLKLLSVSSIYFLLLSFLVVGCHSLPCSCVVEHRYAVSFSALIQESFSCPPAPSRIWKATDGPLLCTSLSSFLIFFNFEKSLREKNVWVLKGGVKCRKKYKFAATCVDEKGPVGGRYIRKKKATKIWQST
jgi:hypothetical protein